jgi:hypothetical protein
MIRVYLSRRNLLTLLNKLDGVREGRPSECTLVKHDNKHPRFPSSHPAIFVTAVEDEDYYTDREPGFVREQDDPGRKS